MTHSQTMSDGMVEITQADRDAATQYDVVEAFARHREQVAAEERAKIVAWLRKTFGFDSEAADAIEAKEHLK